MKRLVAIGFLLGIALLTGCSERVSLEEKSPAVRRVVPIISLATPEPPPQVVAEAEDEEPEKPPKAYGPAQPVPRKTAPHRPPPGIKQPLPSPGKKLSLGLEHDYPKARSKQRAVGRRRPSYNRYTPRSVARLRATRPRRPAPVLRTQPAYRPPPPPIYRPSFPLPQPRRTRPAQPQFKAPPRHYPQVQVSSHRRSRQQIRSLNNDYLQARADALNIKYNGGRPRFHKHSPQVILSASAPPSPRPRVRVPWDKLGNSFHRSEQKRRRLQAAQRGW